MNKSTIYLPPRLELKINLTQEQFWELCQENDDLRFEKTATEELIIMPLTGGNTAERNSEQYFHHLLCTLFARNILYCWVDARNPTYEATS